MKKGLVIAIIALVAQQGNAQTIIYSEDFQSGLPLDYTIVDNDGLTPAAAVSEFTSAWIELTDPDNSLDTVMGSTSYFDPAGQADRWLITPAITLGAYGNIAYWEAKSHDPSFPDDYQVLVSNTDTQLSSFTDTLFSVGGENPDWTSREGNLSELGFNNTTVYLAFVNRTEDGFKLYIDDIRVEMEDPSQLNELSIKQIRIYPNPSSDVVYLDGIQGFESASIYSVSGVLMTTVTEPMADIRNLPQGSYFVKAKGDDGIIHGHFIKF